MRKETINFRDFMSGEYKTKKKAKRVATAKKVSRLAIPAIIGSPTGLLFGAMSAFAATPEVIPVATVGDQIVEGGTHFVSKHTLNIIAHSLDPIVEIMVAFAFPVASVIMAGACFLFMFNRADKGFEMIQRAGLGYVLVQMLPFLLNVLKQVGDAM